MKPRIARLCALALATVGLTAQARAEGNRLLPFWGQPYPYGYVRLGSVAAPPGEQRCRPRGRGDRARIGHRPGSVRCEVVLHARD